MTAIGWTDETLNVSIGCSRVSAGCENCYAERMASRGLIAEHEGTTTEGPRGPRWNGVINLVPERILWPFRWKKPKRVFVNSMSDLFHPAIPEDLQNDVFAMAALNRRHTIQILTKRSREMCDYLSQPGREQAIFETACGMAGEERRRSGREAEGTIWADGVGVLREMPWPLPNVWPGVSIEDQPTADERIPHLLATPAAVRFVSAEPLLGPIKFAAEWLPCPACKGRGWYLKRFSDNHATACARCADEASSLGVPLSGGQFAKPGPRLDQVIVGGESGPGARGCDIGWIRSIARECKESGTACFIKQVGAKPYESHSEMDHCCDRAREHPGKHPLEYRGPDGISRPLKNRKGADPREWPDDLQVQQFPDEEG